MYRRNGEIIGFLLIIIYLLYNNIYYIYTEMVLVHSSNPILFWLLIAFIIVIIGYILLWLIVNIAKRREKKSIEIAFFNSPEWISIKQKIPDASYNFYKSPQWVNSALFMPEWIHLDGVPEFYRSLEWISVASKIPDYALSDGNSLEFYESLEWNRISCLIPDFYNTPWWKELARRIRIRDLYTCQQCYIIGPRDMAQLHVHHKKQRRYGGSDSPSNLMTLCENCHASQPNHTLFKNK
jgi:hypothetical protein